MAVDGSVSGIQFGLVHDEPIPRHQVPLLRQVARHYSLLEDKPNLMS